MTRSIIENNEPIKNWVQVEMRLSSFLDSSKSKDQLMEYLRYLTEKGDIKYIMEETTFDNAKRFFVFISQKLYQQKDLITLGYLAYFTQYFCKEVIAQSSNPFADSENESFEGEFGESLDLDDAIKKRKVDKDDLKEYLLLADEWFKQDFAKDKGFWKMVMTQFNNVLLFANLV